MFKTHVGPVEDEAAVAYLRPETAQGIFVNFKNVQTTSRKKPPFGIAQIGKSFRNEITPGNFMFRTREFEQMEMEFFVPPEDAANAGSSTGAPSATAGSATTASPNRRSASGRTIPRSSPTIPRARATGVRRTPGAGESWRGSPTAPILTSRPRRSTPARTSPITTRSRPPLRPPRHRARRGRRPGHPCLPVAAYRRGGSGGRAPNRLAPRSSSRPEPRSPCCHCPATRGSSPSAEEMAGKLRRHYMIDVDAAGSIGHRYRRQDEVGTPLVRHRRFRLPR